MKAKVVPSLTHVNGESSEWTSSNQNLLLNVDDVFSRNFISQICKWK